MIYPCERIGNSIIVFGIARPVSAHTTERADHMEKHGLPRYCSARDQFGNLYDLHADYDPCLTATYAVALQKKED